MNLSITMGPGKPTYHLKLDGQDIVSYVFNPDALDYMLGWSRPRLLAYAEYRGWTVSEIDDAPKTPLIP